MLIVLRTVLIVSLPRVLTVPFSLIRITQKGLQSLSDRISKIEQAQNNNNNNALSLFDGPQGQFTAHFYVCFNVLHLSFLHFRILFLFLVV